MNIPNNTPETSNQEEESSLKILKRQFGNTMCSNNKSILIYGLNKDDLEEMGSTLESRIPKDIEIIDFDIVDLSNRNLFENYIEKNILIMNVDLENNKQAALLDILRREGQRNSELIQIIITKPGTTSDIPMLHPCFNWTQNLTK